MDHKDTVVIYKLCVCVLATPAMQVFAIDRMQVMNEVYILKFCKYTKHGNEKYNKKEKVVYLISFSSYLTMLCKMTFAENGLCHNCPKNWNHILQ